MRKQGEVEKPCGEQDGFDLDFVDSTFEKIKRTHAKKKQEGILPDFNRERDKRRREQGHCARKPSPRMPATSRTHRNTTQQNTIPAATNGNLKKNSDRP